MYFNPCFSLIYITAKDAHTQFVNYFSSSFQCYLLLQSPLILKFFLYLFIYVPFLAMQFTCTQSYDSNNNNILLEICIGRIAAILKHDVCAHSKIWTMEMNLFIKGHGEKVIRNNTQLCQNIKLTLSSRFWNIL